MEINEFYDYYNEKLETRDLLYSIKEEIEELQDNELVKKYISLTQIFEENKELYDKTDNEALDYLTRNSKIDFGLPDYYVCLGKDLNGYMKNDNEYYILPPDFKPKFFHQPIKVALYINYEDPSIELIVPMKEVPKFEEKHIITRIHSNNPKEEFHNSRTKVIVGELSSHKEKVLK